MRAGPVRRARTLAWLVVLGLGCTSVSGTTAVDAGLGSSVSLETVALQTGDSAPGFVLPLLNHDPIQPIADTHALELLALESLRGKVVYVDFWDTTCGPCREALPALSGLRDQFARDDVEFVAVNLDPDPRAALRFLERYPVSYPVVSDPSGQSARNWGVQALPTAFLIGRDGVVHDMKRGFDVADITRIQSKLTALAVGRKG